MNKDIVLLDLFSGIGGFSKGLSDAGFNITKHYFSEIDKHAIAVYKYQFKNSEYVGSVTTLDGRTITRPNIITFGSPCQDFSVAGKRAGMDGQRSSLIGEALRLITECRPDVFIWENVKGVFSSNNGADFWAIIQAFANIGGYRLEWQLLNTAWVLPQNRERIYLIGHLAETGGQFIFPFRENSSENAELQGQRTNTNTIKARYEANGAGSYIIEDKLNAQINVVGHSGSGGQHGNIHGDGIMSCLTGTDYKQPKQISVLIEPSHKHGEIRYYEDVAPTIQSRYGTGGDNIPYIKNVPHGYNTGFEKQYPNLRAESSSEHNELLVIDKNVRRLTEIECERLQGFPNDWTAIGDYDGVVKPMAKTQRYKMCGNAVTVKIVEMIGKRLLDEPGKV